MNDTIGDAWEWYNELEPDAQEEIIIEAYESFKKSEQSEDNKTLKSKIKEMVKAADNLNEPVQIDNIYSQFNEKKEEIDAVILKLLEDGEIYEPRPGKLRWLG